MNDSSRIGDKNDHLVPRMMIRRFTGADGKLLELTKPGLTIGKRRRGPKGILFQKGFYETGFYNFDEDLLKPIEQSFARFYPILVDGDHPGPMPAGGGNAFVEWVASLMVRTSPAMALIDAVASTHEHPAKDVWLAVPDVLRNTIRNYGYNEYLDIITRPGFRWKVKTYPSDESIILTDHPVCTTRAFGSSGSVLIVPLSKSRVFFGGTSEDLNHTNVHVDFLNFVLAAWANKFVFAADRQTLETVRYNLSGECPTLNADIANKARQPLFGLLSRIAEGQRPDTDTGEWWKAHKARFGESVLVDNGD
jgi:hypothetical protein